MRRFRWLAAASVGLVIAGVLVGLDGVSGAGASGGGDQYTVSARADALAIEYLNSRAPLSPDGQVVYATPATAQALIDGLGRSNSRASAPFPGDLMAGSLSNANGLLVGGGLPGFVPAYPFIVSSSYPGTPSAHQEQDAYRIQANSGENRSAAEARVGVAAGDYLTAATTQASAEAALETATGTLSAAASTRIDGLRVTDLIKIGQSVAQAEIVRAPGRPAEKRSSFTVASIAIASVVLGLGDEGIVVGDKVLPMADLSSIQPILERSGVTVEYLPAAGTEDSIQSAGLRISYSVGTAGGPTQRTTITLGRVSAAIQGSATPTAEVSLPRFERSDTNADPPPVADDVPTVTTNPVAPRLPARSTAATVAQSPPGMQISGRSATGDQIGATVVPPLAGAAETTRIRGRLPDDDVSHLYLLLATVAVVSALLSIRSAKLEDRVSVDHGSTGGHLV